VGVVATSFEKRNWVRQTCALSALLRFGRLPQTLDCIRSNSAFSTPYKNAAHKQTV
jgi:hypothetical protein